MKARTTILLLIAVLILGGYIWFVEREQLSLEERREQALRALRIVPERITLIRFEDGDRVIECARQEGIWTLLEPVRTRADSGEIDRLLNGLKLLQRGEVITARERIQQELSLADYGLERPRRRIMLGDDHLRRVILIGRTAPLGDSVYIMESGQEDIVAVDKRLLELFPADVAELRDRIVLHGDPVHVNRLEVRRPGGFLQLVRAEDGSWQIQQPVQARADRASVHEVLAAIFRLRVVDFIADEVADATAYGLDETVTQVTVWLDQRETGDTLLLGQPLEQNPDLIYARRRTGDSIFAVSRDIVDKVRVRPEDLRDRQLIPLKAYNVGIVRMTRDEQSVRLERTDADTWHVVEPGNWKADANRVEALVTAWTGARVLSFIDDAGTNVHEWGFTDDALRIAFGIKEDRIPQQPAIPGAARTRKYTLKISELVRDGGRLVKIEDEPTLYEIKEDVVLTVSLDPLYYRDRSVFRVVPDQVRRIALIRDGEEQVVVRGPHDAFYPDAGRTEEVRAAAVQALLAKLANLDAVEYVTDDPGSRDVYGLHEPRATLSIGLTGISGIAKALYFGESRADGSVYAMSRGHDVIFLLDRDTRDILLRDIVRVEKEDDETNDDE